MELPGIKAKSLSIGLPFGLGQIEFEANEQEQRAAWSLYVELQTRIAVQSLDPDTGLLREALSSLYLIFELTRKILKEAGPQVAHGEKSFGPVAIAVLNEGLRPFTAYWHPRLLAYEQNRADVDALAHEKMWIDYDRMRNELTILQQQMQVYVDVLAQISGAKDF